MIIRHFTGKFPFILPLRLRKEFDFYQRLLLYIRSLRGYELYYAETENSIGGYCFLKENYCGRYSFVEKNDYIVNPYFTAPEYRGKGIATKLLSVCTQAVKNRIWAVVDENNIVSIYVLKKVGFRMVGFTEKRGWKYKMTQKKRKLVVFEINSSDTTSYPTNFR